MARESPTGDGDGRGTPPHGRERGPPTGDPPRGRNSFSGARDGNSAFPVAGEDGAGHGNASSAFPGARYGEQGHRDVRRSADLGHDVASDQKKGMGNFWGLFKFHGIGTVIQNVKSAFRPAASTQESSPEELPRLSVYVDTLIGPAMSRSQEVELKQELEFVLRQMQNSVKSMGLQPVHLGTVQPPPSRGYANHSEHPLPLEPTEVEYPIGAYACLSDYNRFKPPRSGRSYMPLRSPRSANRSTERVLNQKEEENEKLVEAIEIIEQCTFEMKRSITSRLDSKEISPEFAKELGLILHCMDTNCKIALKSGWHFFSLAGLREKIKVPADVKDWVVEWKNFTRGMLFVATLTERAIRSVSTSHVRFDAIGKESNRIINAGYTLDEMRSYSDAFDNGLFGLGGQFGGDRSVKQLMFKLKNQKNSMSFNLNAAGANAAPNGNLDMASVRISVDKPMETGIKYIVEVPYPSFDGKFFEFRGGIPHVAYAGALQLKSNPRRVELPRIPVFDISAVMGMKYIGLGIQFQFSQGQLSPSLAFSFRNKLSAVGLKCNNSGHCVATFCKELVGTSTTLAGQAWYSPPLPGSQVAPAAGQNPGSGGFAVGLKHAFDTTMYCKAKVGTGGASVLLKKDRSGKLSVKGALNIDFANPARIPKMGVVFSYRG